MEFEPPKRKALSESELHRALTGLGNTSDGLVQAEVLLSNQALAREEDSVALAKWISEMQALGTPDAQRALASMVLDVMPPALVETEPAQEIESEAEREPVFTSEISIIRSRREIRERSLGLRRITAGLAGLLLIALANGFIANWLKLSLSESLISAVVGMALSLPLILILKSHSLHPLLRSASTFGGWGVYLGAGLILASIGVLITSGIEHHEMQPVLTAFISPYPTEILFVGVLVLVISQSVPRTWFFGTLAVSGLTVLGYLFIRNPESFAGLQLMAPANNQLLWGSLTMGSVTAVIYILGQPHQSFSKHSLSWQLPLGLVFSALSIVLQQGTIAPYAVAGVFYLGMALSGRDLSIHGLGRLAGLAFFISVIGWPVIDSMSGPAIAILSALLILVTFDQLFRRSSLHIPSLDTSYGFYGSFQPLSVIAILLAAASGVGTLQTLGPNFLGSNHYETSLLAGLSIGLFFGLLRIVSIRKQDREIRNVEFRNMNLDNLLGL